MSEIKTKKHDGDVEEFLNLVENEKQKKDSFEILELMSEVTGEEPAMWGPSIIGFGDYHYKYKSGRENDWFLVGFSPRKQSLTLYLNSGVDESDQLMKKLGKYKTGKVCIYINKIEDINKEILKELIQKSVKELKKTGILSENK